MNFDNVGMHCSTVMQCLVKPAALGQACGICWTGAWTKLQHFWATACRGQAGAVAEVMFEAGEQSLQMSKTMDRCVLRW